MSDVSIDVSVASALDDSNAISWLVSLWLGDTGALPNTNGWLLCMLVRTVTVTALTSWRPAAGAELGLLWPANCSGVPATGSL